MRRINFLLIFFVSIKLFLSDYIISQPIFETEIENFEFYDVTNNYVSLRIYLKVTNTGNESDIFYNYLKKHNNSKGYCIDGAQINYKNITTETKYPTYIGVKFKKTLYSFKSINDELTFMNIPKSAENLFFNISIDCESIKLNITEGFNKAIDYMVKASVCLNKNDNYSAIEYLKKTIENYPNNYEAYFTRGKIYENEKKYFDALKDFNRVSEINSIFEKAYYEKGYIYYQQSNYEDAINEFKKAIKYKSKYEDAFYYRGLCYWAKGLNYSAIEDFSEAIKLDSLDEYNFDARGKTYDKLNMFDKAEKDYLKAIKINTKFVGPYISIGYLYYNDENYYNAIKYWEYLKDINYSEYLKILPMINKANEKLKL